MEKIVDREKHGRAIKIENYPVTFTAMIHDKIDVLAGPLTIATLFPCNLNLESSDLPRSKGAL